MDFKAAHATGSLAPRRHLTTGSWEAVGNVVVARSLTSVERLAMKLMARVLNPRRPANSRLIAGLLLLPVGPLAIASKLIGYAVFLFNSMAFGLVVCTFGWLMLRGNPETLEILRQGLHWLGQVFLDLTK